MKKDNAREEAEPGAVEITSRHAIALEPSRVEAYRDHGRLMIRNSRYLEAERIFETVAKIEPGNAIGYSDLAAALIGRGRFEDAREVCAVAIDLDPCCTNAYANSGFAWFSQHHLRDAVADLGAALSLDPMHVAANVSLNAVIRAATQLNDTDTIHECQKKRI